MANPSVSHPILVDPAPSRAPGDLGRVGMTTAPGKQAKSGAGTWARDLGVDLARLRVDYKTDVLVCLLEPQELVGLGIPGLAGAAPEAGIQFDPFPIPRGGVPEDIAAFKALLDRIHAHVVAGRNVVVHSDTGLGRVGLVVASYLRGPEVDEDQAIRLVRIARVGVLVDAVQQRFVRRAAWLPSPAGVLLEAIYTDPADLGLRGVYADLLTEQGDPRGEFITLGLARLNGTADDAMVAREHHLWTTLGPRWYAPLGQLIDYEQSTCKAGFLDYMAWRPMKSPGHEAAVTRYARGAACWSTVRVVRVGGAGLGPDRPVTLLADPVCANVEEVGHLTARDYRLLRRQTLPWRVVEIEWSWPVDVDDAPRFPNLQEVRVDTTSALLGTRMPFWNTVERLVIGKAWEDVLDVVSWMPSLRSVRYWTGGARAEWRRVPGRPWKRL